jgi:hypothetical protein
VLRRVDSHWQSGRPAGISDGNRGGNNGSRQHPEADMNNLVPSDARPEPGIRYT